MGEYHLCSSELVYLVYLKDNIVSCSVMTNIVFPPHRRTLVVHFSKASEEEKSKYYIPVCLKKVRCYSSKHFLF